MKVYKTVNYDKFSYHDTNRNINKYHVNRLKKAIATENLLLHHPILVSYDDIVIDGQHRLAAAKALELPIYYTYIDVKNPTQSILLINNNVRKWSLRDYAEAYAKSGKRDYQILLDFCAAHQVNISKAIIYTSNWNRRADSFREGKFKIKSLKHANDCMELDNAMTPFMENKHYKNRYMQEAIAHFIYNGFDKDRLIHKLTKLNTPIPAYGSFKLSLRALEDIYNLYAKKQVRLF